MGYSNSNNCFVNNNTAGASCDCGCGNSGGFSCIINLIIILIVLEFLSNIICGLDCQIC